MSGSGREYRTGSTEEPWLARGERHAGEIRYSQIKTQGILLLALTDPNINTAISMVLLLRGIHMTQAGTMQLIVMKDLTWASMAEVDGWNSLTDFDTN